MEQTVDAAQVHKRTVVGEVLDDTLEYRALFEVGQQFLALGGVDRLHHRAAGYHHVVALLIELDDLEFEGLVFQVRGFAHGANVHQGAGQESAQAGDVDGETALDLAADDTGNHLIVVEGLLQLDPGLLAAGLLTGQAGGAETVFDGLEGNLNFVADLQGALAIVVEELADGNHALGLEAGVDGNPVLVDIDDDAGDNGARRHLDGFQALFKEFCETFAH